MSSLSIIAVGAETADGFEGSLIRKHTYETQERKAPNRSWDKLYCVLRGNTLAFYKDHKHKVRPFHALRYAYTLRVHCRRRRTCITTRRLST